MSERGGYVYFIQAQRSETELTENWVKIGYSVHPGWRVAELQTGCPYPIRLIQAIPGTKKHEERMHRYFSEHKVHGEWYVPVPALAEVIEIGKFPFIEHPELMLSKTHDGKELLMFRCGFVSSGDMSLLRGVLANVEERGISLSQWLEEAISEKLSRSPKTE